MSSSNTNGSLLIEAAQRTKAKTAWDILGEQPPLGYCKAPSRSLGSDTPNKVSTKQFADSKDIEEKVGSKTTQISYFARSVSVTPVVGAGVIYIDFEVESPDGKSIVTFSGSVKTFNVGAGGDVGYVESSGMLTGPYIYWNKKAMIKALDGKTVTGKAFTFALINGFTIAAEFNIGEYNDPSYSYEVDGISVGWEGFRGPFRVDKNSFSVKDKKK